MKYYVTRSVSASRDTDSRVYPTSRASHRGIIRESISGESKRKSPERQEASICEDRRGGGGGGGGGGRGVRFSEAISLGFKDPS